ncbi:HTH-type transcriptional regulator GltC [Dickeya solani]|nr:HTH-type transcriptional regulator GltC [Dickeya solani]
MTARYLQDTALRYFLEVVRCGSISEAALRLNVAGSAISRQVSGLEDRLNTILFERRKSGMTPPPPENCWRPTPFAISWKPSK